MEIYIDYVRLGGAGFYASQFESVIANYSSTKFNFFLGSCHGGSIDNLSTLENVRLVLTAAKSNEFAWSDWDACNSSTDYNAYNVRSEWTSSIFESAKLILENSTKRQMVSNYASTYKIPTTSVSSAFWSLRIEFNV